LNPVVAYFDAVRLDARLKLLKSAHFGITGSGAAPGVGD
jgi:hypothetical protein